jgi:hypothetical protein
MFDVRVSLITVCLRAGGGGVQRFMTASGCDREID